MLADIKAVSDKLSVTDAEKLVVAVLFTHQFGVVERGRSAQRLQGRPFRQCMPSLFQNRHFLAILRVPADWRVDPSGLRMHAAGDDSGIMLFHGAVAELVR